MGRDENIAIVAVLRACAKNKDLQRGVRIHDDIESKGLIEKYSDALVTMYAKCGALGKAKELFDTHRSRNLFTWTALISGYVENGQGQEALNHFEWMQHEGVSPDAVTYSCVLRACGSVRTLQKGKEIHNEIARRELLRNCVVLGNAVVSMYAKCGALTRAWQILEQLSDRNVVSWTALIEGYAEYGQGEQALDCFRRMQQEGLSPNAVTYICILKACSSTGAPDMGERIHEEIAKQGLLGKDVVLCNALVSMYAKCGALAKARSVVEEVPVQTVIAWTALIAGYAEHGESEQALSCYESMQEQGLTPNAVTLVCTLAACASIGTTEKGDIIHHEIIKQGLVGINTVVGNALIDMYSKFRELTKARQVLEELPVRNVVSWTTLIIGYAECGEGELALDCYKRMQQEGFSPNAVTFACILKACGSVGAAEMGERVHDEIAKQGLLRSDMVLGGALVDMYAKCGALAKARRVLEELPARNAISWNALITKYTECGEGAQALDCFERMQDDKLSPDAVTFICILKSCGSLGAVDKGEEVHEEIAKQALLASHVGLGNALVDMYAKCGALAKARQVIAELPVRNVISWTALIAGYAEHGKVKEALNCLEQMRSEGLSPDAATLSCLLTACSRSGLIEDTQTYFLTMCTSYGMRPDLEHYTCMVDMFGRAGYLDRAVKLIEKLPAFTDVIWSAVLGACKKWGDVEAGIWAFEHTLLVDKTDASSYVLMIDIYMAAGMQSDAEKIEALRVENKAQ